MDKISNWVAVLASIASIIGAIAAFYFVWDNNRKSRLIALCRRALQDCLAFYHLEEGLCRRIAQLEGGDQTPLGVKRFYRAHQRGHGIPSPSEDATPKKLEEELAKL